MMLDSATSLCAVKSSMMHITGHDRGQMLLLPEQLDDYVDSDNPMRFIDELNLSAAGFIRAAPSASDTPQRNHAFARNALAERRI